MSGGGGIYVHFAYCTRRCSYCDFALATPRSIPAGAYTDALVAELATKVDSLGGPAGTLYLGGGTPSLWPLAELERFMAAVYAAPGLEAGAEVTIEANPDEVDERWLDAVIDLGVNRVSLGVQSLDDGTLTALTRTHDAAAAEAALSRLADAFESGRLASFSVDLIYGLAGQTLAAWRQQLTSVVGRWGPPHLSLYALTVEPRTVLSWQIHRGRAAPPDEHLQAEMLFGARDLLAGHGYQHYEVSSWARPGHVARHNSAYWELRPWLGLGAGAHGFTAGRHTSNVPRPARYIQRMAADGEAAVEVEAPDAPTLDYERLMVGLRRLDRGVALPSRRFDAAVAREVAAGRLVREGDVIRLTDLGLRFMDDVLLALLP